jgi:hypothetical protein
MGRKGGWDSMGGRARRRSRWAMVRHNGAQSPAYMDAEVRSQPRRSISLFHSQRQPDHCECRWRGTWGGWLFAFEWSLWLYRGRKWGRSEGILRGTVRRPIFPVPVPGSVGSPAGGGRRRQTGGPNLEEWEAPMDPHRLTQRLRARVAEQPESPVAEFRTREGGGPTPILPWTAPCVYRGEECPPVEAAP